jgi:Calcineurin-like phosphoesterase
VTKSAFSKSYIRFVVGNHEAFPVDNVDIRSPNEPKTGVWYYEKFLSAYETLILVEQRIDFNNRGYYSQYFADYNVRFININTLAMDNMNFYMFVYKFDPNDMFEWMWYILRDAEKRGEAVYFNMHIPPGSTSTYQLFDELFNDTIERFRNIIRGVFSAHTHVDLVKFTRERKDNRKIVKPNFIGASLTTKGGNQPSFRVFEIDKRTGVIADIIQYRMDVEKWNAAGEKADPTFEEVYRYKAAYGLPDLSKSSMQSLYDRLMNDDPATWNTYLEYKKSGRNSIESSRSKKGLPAKSDQSNVMIGNDPNFGTKCNMNTESREKVKCIGWNFFTLFKGDLFDVFITSFFRQYMKFVY